MTIKEKARVAWEKDLEVLVIVDAGHEERRQGWVDYFMGDNVHIDYRKNEGGCTVPYRAITDIQFVEEEDPEKEITEKSKAWEVIQEANNTGFRIGVVYNYPDRQSTVYRSGQVMAIMQRRFRLRDVGWICLDAVISIERLDAEEVEKSCNTTAKDEAWEVIQESKRTGSRIGIAYNESSNLPSLHCIGQVIDLSSQYCFRKQRLKFRMSSCGWLYLDRVTRAVKLDAEEVKPPHDIAKERWMRIGNQLYQSVDSQAEAGLIGQFNGFTDKTMTLLTTAPYLADLLRDAVNYVTGRGQYLNAAQFAKQITLLRKLGVPDVAPWYKGG